MATLNYMTVGSNKLEQAKAFYDGLLGSIGWQKAFEALAGVGQFGRDARRARMDLGADMGGDQTHDALAIGGRQHLPRIGQTFGELINPDSAIRVEHHLDDRRIVQMPRDGGSERCAQHTRAAGASFVVVLRNRHLVPVFPSGTTRTVPARG